VATVVRQEFAGWREEQRSWIESVSLLDRSHHMADLKSTEIVSAVRMASLGVVRNRAEAVQCAQGPVY
jgi:hypothetical protein